MFIIVIDLKGSGINTALLLLLLLLFVAGFIKKVMADTPVIFNKFWWKRLHYSCSCSSLETFHD